jgi:hypothetical protein
MRMGAGSFASSNGRFRYDLPSDHSSDDFGGKRRPLIQMD